MSRDYDRKRRVVGNEAKQRNKRPPVVIVHLDDGHGLALCGLREPYPSPSHSLAIDTKNQLDICMTCKDQRRYRSGTPD